jgi:GAF domain-containing protein
LRADAALLTEIRGGREHVRWAVGEGGHAGRVYALRDTICERLLDGRIGSVVTDTATEPGLSDLPAARDIGAYLGVPFRTADARAYVLCCLAHEARPDLGASDVRFLQGLAESLRPVLEAAR